MMQVLIVKYDLIHSSKKKKKKKREKKTTTMFTNFK